MGLWEKECNLLLAILEMLAKKESFRGGKKCAKILVVSVILQCTIYHIKKWWDGEITHHTFYRFHCMLQSLRFVHCN